MYDDMGGAEAWRVAVRAESHERTASAYRNSLGRDRRAVWASRPVSRAQTRDVSWELTESRELPELSVSDEKGDEQLRRLLLESGLALTGAMHKALINFIQAI